MAIAFIASFHFNPAHVSHMIASYKQCEDLGYESYYYVDKAFVPFLPDSSRYVIYGEHIPVKVDLLVLTFPSPQNLQVLRKLKRSDDTKVIYVFHEPLDKFSVLRKSGFTTVQLLKAYIMGKISAITVKKSYAILLPSQKAVTFYDANPLYKNTNRHYIPLLYDDERAIGVLPQRQFFSYIGTVAPDHSFNEYVSFVTKAVKEERLKNLQFLIATKSEFEVTEDIQKCIDSGRLTIYKGKPMTNEEINNHYASSYAIWNAYGRTMQSGVLAKSFMFGTPAIVLRSNLNEFMDDHINVVAVEDNSSFEQIEVALKDIFSKFDAYSKACRVCFLNSFYYKKYNEQFAEIIK